VSNNPGQFRRDIKAFILSLLLYTPLILLWAKNDTVGFVSEPLSRTITLDINSFKESTADSAPSQGAEEPVEISKAPEKPEEKEPEKAKEEAKQPEQPKPLEVPQPLEEKSETLPAPKPIVQAPKPSVKKTDPLPKESKRTKNPTKKEVKNSKKTAVATKAPNAPKGGRASSKQKNLFLSTLKRKIDRAKSYPLIAQRRGMTGIVSVNFTVGANGQPGNIQVSGPRIFLASAKSAVLGAFPISTQGVDLPLQISFTLNYTINN